MKYYVNKDTGELLDELQMRKQWRDVYDGDDPLNILTYHDQYEEVQKVEWLGAV